MDDFMSIFKINSYKYPDKSTLFRPDMAYPEYIFGEKEISEDTNEVYYAVRQSLYQMGLDKDNYGTEKWNPLGEFVHENGTILIKPNLVMDKNLNNEFSEDCLYTQPAVVAPVIDYCIKALDKKGKIIIGDAPMQECNFENLIVKSGYKDLIDYYKNKEIDIELIDFRELKSEVVGGVHKSEIGKKSDGCIIDLGHDSEFDGISLEQSRKLRITNYNPEILQMHHTDSIHEYYISKHVLNADLIINMPKPKCHRKAGVTISLKNMVGINVRKEYLPHHTLGSINEGGDEYEKKSLIHTVRSKMMDKKNYYISHKFYIRARIVLCLAFLCTIVMKFKNPKHKLCGEGNWYGNQTISKTIADLNKIVLYADKYGIMKDTVQRQILIIGDMIVSGEGEGPLMPMPKNVGIVAIGKNQVHYDMAISKIMGFDFHKIPSIVTAASINGRYRLHDKKQKIKIVSNIKNYNDKYLDCICAEDAYNFRASDGWIGHIEL